MTVDQGLMTESGLGELHFMPAVTHQGCKVESCVVGTER